MSAPDEENNNDEQDRITVTLLILRIITLACPIAVLVFVEISIVILGGDVTEEMSPMAWGAIGVAVAAIVASRVVPGRIASAKTSHEPTIEELLGSYTTRLIIGLAILEGAAFFSVVVFLVKAQWPLLIATAVLAILMIAKFPTRSGLERWIKERRQLAELGGEGQG